MTIIGMVHGEAHVITGAKIGATIGAVTEVAEAMGMVEEAMEMVAAMVTEAVAVAEEIRDTVNRVYK